MRNTVLAVQPDSFPKIRRIGTKIESSPTCSTELFQSSGIFQVGSIFGGRTRISPRHCSRPGKSINAAPDLYTVPWKEGFRCLSPRDTIQPPPWQGLHPSFETVSFEGLRRHCREPLLPRKGKKDSIRGMLEYVELYVNADQRTVQFCLFALPLSTFIVCVIWRALCSVTSIPSSSSSKFASSPCFKLEKKSRFD